MRNYESHNPYDSYFSTAPHMGFDTQHVGQSRQGFDAPPPPPREQPRPSMTNELAADLFGAPHGTASSAFTSHTATTMPSFFKSSFYTTLGSHWTQPHDYTPHDEDDH
jgi:hypothetical protein